MPRTTREGPTHKLGFTLALALISGAAAFQNSAMPRTCSTCAISASSDTTSIVPKSLALAFASPSSTRLFFENRDADMMEVFAGGMRYEMVELPDSLVDTTVFIGNLCEFVTDDMLSTLFRQASSLNFIPACVARKPNSSSLKHGFATFPSVEEKEAAIVRFTGYLLNDRPMRVESIVDYKYRVRVPEKLVTYTVGEVKRTRDGTRNTMRMARNSRVANKKDKRGRPIFSDPNVKRGNSRSNGKKKKFQRRQRRKNGNADLDSSFL
eukprot:CAMPEP_0197247088 /NCGR_PEP_ID=MMETSP1429-20130617/26092_1 /TAXON_ID=49237 /ORGANISM="Chaetoceros  sp., Strain UNC1202" /LENGTH=265 /DNA_ID=CAMNT_0042707905 /DNA_START=103 /DNA_END=900 /DNA_ORIENTATION=-